MSCTSGTILVCEDDKHLGVVIEIMLREHGYRVLVANRPDEALKLAATHDGPIDLFITDVVLQGTRGPELARQLRSMRPELEVLFVSGYSPHDVEHLQLPEGAAFLQKPFHPETLSEKVRERLNGLEPSTDRDRARTTMERALLREPEGCAEGS